MRLDDRISENPKLDAVGPIGSWLHVCAIAYCNRHLTDGVFPQRIVQRLGAFDWADPETAGMPALLIKNGLWHGPGHSCGYCPGLSPGHYLVHGYADFQPSRADVEARRERLSEYGKKGATKRWQEWQETKAQLDGQSMASAIAQAMPEAMAARTVANNAPNPTQPKSVSKETLSSADEIFEVLLAVCGIDPDDVSATARPPYLKAARDLAGLGASPECVMDRAVAYRQTWPAAALTPTALVRRWAECQGSANDRVLRQFAAGAGA